MSEFTEGPWEAREYGDHTVMAIGPVKDWIAIPQNNDKRLANARLIAAAPEMLEALEEIVKRNEIQNWFNLDLARTAIAKAKGKLNVSEDEND